MHARIVITVTGEPMQIEDTGTAADTGIAVVTHHEDMSVPDSVPRITAADSVAGSEVTAEAAWAAMAAAEDRAVFFSRRSCVSPFRRASENELARSIQKPARTH